MQKVLLDYSLKYSTVQRERETLDISSLDINWLKSMAQGVIYVFFEPQRSYIILETGIIDYLIQFKNVIEEIDSGNYNSFSVSCDFYSNSIEYLYDNKSKDLTLIERNAREFEIITKYNKFKEAVLKFHKNTVKDLIIVYPELQSNKAFTHTFIK